MPKAIKLPSAATMRPLDLAGLNSLTQMGVVAVLKPLPHPLQDASCNRQTILISQYVQVHQLTIRLCRQSSAEHQKRWLAKLLRCP